MAGVRLLFLLMTGFAIAGFSSEDEGADDSLADDGFAEDGGTAGTDGDDTIAGSDADDFLMGLGGDDQIDAGPGNDQIDGLGNDSLEGAISEVPMGADIDGADTLFGGEGNDTLSLGEGDEGTGGAGEDLFVAGTWVTSEIPTIMDYLAGEDQILVNYDAALMAGPDLTVDTVASGAETFAVISVDGEAVCRILINAGMPAPDVSEIALVAAEW